MIFAVTGGRDVVIDEALADRFWWALCTRASLHLTHTLRHGAARGVDTWVADAVAARFSHRWVAIEPWPARWDFDGKAAGPIRNRAMLAGSWTTYDGKPRHQVDVLLAFPGGRGTADCVRAARDFGIPVVEVAP